jgi:hypothetical protein
MISVGVDARCDQAAPWVRDLLGECGLGDTPPLGSLCDVAEPRDMRDVPTMLEVDTLSCASPMSSFV